jgi:hypothetical protein
VTGIAEPLIYNTTRACVERGELEPVPCPAAAGGVARWRRRRRRASWPRHRTEAIAAADQTPKPGLIAAGVMAGLIARGDRLETSGALRTSVVTSSKLTTFRSGLASVAERLRRRRWC